MKHTVYAIHNKKYGWLFSFLVILHVFSNWFHSFSVKSHENSVVCRYKWQISAAKTSESWHACFAWAKSSYSYYIEDLLSNYMLNDNSFSNAYRGMQENNNKFNSTKIEIKSSEKSSEKLVCVCERHSFSFFFFQVLIDCDSQATSTGFFFKFFSLHS